MRTFQNMIHQFYSQEQRLFELGDAVEYDTATPYRYVVAWFVELAERIQQGQPVTVISRSELEETVVLDTVADLMHWIAQHFRGFDYFVQQRIDNP